MTDARGGDGWLSTSEVSAASGYSVQQVRDLEAKHEASARSFIDQLLAKQSQPEEVDPFA